MLSYHFSRKTPSNNDKFNLSPHQSDKLTARFPEIIVELDMYQLENFF